MLWEGNTETFTRESAKPWIDVGEKIGPGGMTFGNGGNLYVAIFGGRAVKIISPERRVIGQITLDGDNPSNCNFVGFGWLIITETGHGRLLSIDIRSKWRKIV